MRWYCSPERFEEISGDIEEVFEEALQNEGLTKARISCWLLVAKCFKPYAYQRHSKKSKSNFTVMYINNLKVAYRNFSKHRSYGFINLSGLIIGMISCLLIASYVSTELSFDGFHDDVDRIYRLRMDRFSNKEQIFQSAVTFPAVGPNLHKDQAAVETFLRILPFGGGVYTHSDENGNISTFNEDKGVYADSNFFQLFKFKLLKGSPEDVLSGPNKVVISEGIASKYFGEADPIGKTLNYRGNRDLEVTGVMAEMPTNSHMHFEIIQSMASQGELYNRFPENWGWYDFYTFIKLNPETNTNDFQESLTNYLRNYKGERFDESGMHETLHLQPLKEIHLYSNLSWDMGENGGAEAVYFLMVIAVIIMIIAWSNFVNLATAQATKRAKETGVRKSLGAKRKELIGQFLVESFLYNLVAMLVSISAVVLLLPQFNELARLSIPMTIFLNPIFISGLLVLLIIGTFLSGLYPAFVLTSFDPVQVLKGKQSRVKGGVLRKSLVIFQFCISVVLIAGTMLVVRQVKFMKSQDLGISIDETLVLVSPTSIADRQDLIDRSAVLKNKLNGLADIRSVSFSSNLPGRENFSIGGFAARSRPEDYQDIYLVSCDYQFMEDFEIEFLDGRGFSEDILSDTNAVIINEVAMNQLQLENTQTALQDHMIFRNGDRPIIGVVKSYHQESLKKELDPVIFLLNAERGRYYSLKLATTDLPKLIEEVEKAWKEVFPQSPLDYYFLDEQFDAQYKSDEIFNKIFMGFAFLAIFVACLGLFGLISFSAAQRLKEIGIRKVLGSSEIGIMFLLSRDYLKMIVISMMIAFPATWYLMDLWLRTFPYRTAIKPDIFALSALITLIIAVGTVSIQTAKAAAANPARSLRNE